MNVRKSTFLMIVAALSISMAVMSRASSQSYDFASTDATASDDSSDQPGSDQGHADQSSQPITDQGASDSSADQPTQDASAGPSAPSNPVNPNSVNETPDKVAVTFTSYADRPLAFHAMDGQGVGFSKGPVRLTMMVDVATANAAISPLTGEVDGPTLLRSLSPLLMNDGHNYYAMKVLQPISLADGRTIIPDSESAPSEVLLNVDDFKIAKVVYPMGAQPTRDATPHAATAARNLNQHIQEQGLTERSAPAPTLPQNAASSANDTVLPDQNDDEDEGDSGSVAYGIGLKSGDPFPEHFLSAPVCSCLGKVCGLSSGFGWRAHKDKHGHWATFKAGNGYGSMFHKGLDINTAAHQVGTPVVAAAPGVLKIPVVNGRPAHKVGDPVLMSQIREGGYGFTLHISHGNGFETQYSHLKSFVKGLRWGMPIRRGQRIATMGASGHATGPHLHFAVSLNGTYVDPKKFLVGDDGEGTLNGRFFGQSCTAQRSYRALDIEMLHDLHGTSHVGGYSAGKDQPAVARGSVR